MQIYVKDNKALSLENKFLSPATSGETWVLNDRIPVPEPLLIGEVDTIVYDAPEFSWGASDTATSINMTYADKIYYYNLSFGQIYISRVDTTTTAQDGWSIKSTYRTLTFTSSPTGDLLTWLQANAVKQ